MSVLARVLAVLLFGGTLSGLASAEVLIDFDELTSFPDGGGNYYDGYGGGARPAWSSQGVTFNTNPWGPGWSYSRVNDPTTPGFTNQWAAIPGADVSGSGNYVIGTTFSDNGAFFNLPETYRAVSVNVSNSTYAALSMRDGDRFAKAFGGPSGDDPDFFKVTFTGFAQADASGEVTGTRDFYLADYRSTDNSLDYIVEDWRLVDLTPLGAARSVGISLRSSDNGDFGMNTPAYVAIDNLAVSSVPEPSVTILAGLVALGYAARARRKRRIAT